MGEAVRPIEQLEPGAPIVVFENVSIGFEGKSVLKNISFEVDRGQTMIILGPAGCGKPVLMKLANGLLSPDSGVITVFGQEISAMGERQMFQLRAHIGMVFQESALFDSLDVEDNVAYRLHEEHMPEDQAHAKVVEALKFVELEAAIAKFPSELSCGMRRRVSIARAIITAPDLILYDSPTGGLDPITSTTIVELGDEAAGRFAYDFAADYAPDSGCVYAGDASVQPTKPARGADSERRHRRQHALPDVE